MATMETPSTITGIVDVLRDRAGVETVFGTPIEREGRTVVPVARVSYGFGGGWGSGASEGESEFDDEAGEPGEEAAEALAELDVDPESFGEGGGFGGGLSAKPVGALEITDDGTRFVRFADRRRTALALLAGVAVGVILGRGGSGSEE